MKNYRHLKTNERELIFLYINQGKSYREIGDLIGRNYRTIGREIKRNGLLGYFPSRAQRLADRRREESKKGKLDEPVVTNYIIRKLGRHWSPK